MTFIIIIYYRFDKTSGCFESSGQRRRVICFQRYENIPVQTGNGTLGPFLGSCEDQAKLIVSIINGDSSGPLETTLMTKTVVNCFLSEQAKQMLCTLQLVHCSWNAYIKVNCDCCSNPVFAVRFSCDSTWQRCIQSRAFEPVKRFVEHLLHWFRKKNRTELSWDSQTLEKCRALLCHRCFQQRKPARLIH